MSRRLRRSRYGEPGRDALVELIAIAVLSLFWLGAWSAVLHTVFGILDVPRTIGRTVLVYAGVTFVNSVMPFAQLGGEAVAGWVVSRSTDADYETSLATVASVDLLNVFPSVVLAFVGTAVFAATATLGRQFEVIVSVFGSLVLLDLLVGYVGWQHRRRIGALGVRVIARASRSLARIVPRFVPPDATTIENQVDTVLRRVERIAADRRGLRYGLGFSVIG